MTFIIWMLTAILVLDCLLLMLLVLIQLPKKEAGLGQAFGSAATDTLFGPGSGNVLTKLTKYTTGIFFVATLVISILQGHEARGRIGDPRLKLSMEEKLATVPKAPPASNAPAANSLSLTSQPPQLKLTGGAPATAAPPASTTPPANTQAPK